MKLISTLFAGFLLIAGYSHAQQKEEQFNIEIIERSVPQSHVKYFTQLNQNVIYSSQNLQRAELGLGQFNISLDQVVSLGEKFWTMITNAAGELKITQMSGVSALPEGILSASGLSGWKMANPRSYDMSIKGTFGTAFTFSYTVGFSYNGNHRGAGKFLTNVAILPYNAKCGLGWKCTLDAQVGNAINVGTSESPIAALPINLLVNAVGKINSKAAGAQIAVYGDGRIERTGDQ
jgi:hypothetical protein